MAHALLRAGSVLLPAIAAMTMLWTSPPRVVQLPAGVVEVHSEIVVKAELPGMDRKDIAINLEKNVLTLRGERRFTKEAKDDNYHRIERSYGAFSRAFSIPATVDEEKISADYKEGVLKIVLPKKEQVKPKQIRIAE